MIERSETTARSPLNLVVLALLYECPMHPYRMHKLIQERGKDEVVNIRSRNSIQQTVNRLEREGLIEENGTEREANYPSRTIYAITDTGRAAVLDSLRRLLSSPAREYPSFPAALAFLTLMSPRRATELLRARRDELAELTTRKKTATKHAAERLPRIFLIEDDYTITMRQAEIAWLDRTIEAMESGDLTWNTQELIEQSPQYER